MRYIANAKVNVSLEVESVRPDGFHPYESIAISVNLADYVYVTIGPRCDESSTVVSTTSTGLDDTLAARAVHAVLTAAGDARRVEISIDKHIPVGAGLGGGSADAAAALVAMNDLLGTPLDCAQMASIAVSIGTDVPFCLTGGCARLHGRGELVEPRPMPAPIAVLVTVPPVHASTGAVFTAFDRIGRQRNPEVPAFLRDAFPGCSFRNDLEPAALIVEPELGRHKARIEEITGRPAFMTGSGSGFVTYAPVAGGFRDAVRELESAGFAVHSTSLADHGVERVD